VDLQRNDVPLLYQRADDLIEVGGLASHGRCQNALCQRGRTLGNVVAIRLVSILPHRAFSDYPVPTIRWPKSLLSPFTFHPTPIHAKRAKKPV